MFERFNHMTGLIVLQSGESMLLSWDDSGDRIMLRRELTKLDTTHARFAGSIDMSTSSYCTPQAAADAEHALIWNHCVASTLVNVLIREIDND